MSLLSRRIFWECVKVFGITLVVLMTFVLMGRALQLKDTLFGLDLGFLDTVLIFSFLSPSFLMLMAPVSVMIAVFLTFLRMGADREFVAVKAGGISLYQLLPAPLLFGFICTLLTFCISYTFISWGSNNFRNLLMDIAQTRVSIALQPGTFNQDIPNMVFYARQVDQEKGTLAHVLIEDTSREDAKLLILAPRGNLDVDYTQGEILLLLQDGMIYTQQEQRLTQLGFEEYVVRFSLSSLVQGLDLGAIKPKEMHWDELMNFDVNNEIFQQMGWVNKVKVEMHKRFLFPISCMVLTVFAIVIASSCQGVHKQVGLVWALIIFFVYYSLISFGMNMAEFSGGNAFLTIWLPVLIFLLVGIVGIIAAARERAFSISNILHAFPKFVKKKSPLKTTQGE